jgi:hypothetical protein
MAYITPGDLKDYLGIEVSIDDPLLTLVISRAQKAIETHTGRLFECSTDSTRYFEVGLDTNGDWLYLDKDLAAITSITNDADGSSPDVLSSSDYITSPRNITPYSAIKLLGSSNKSWDYTDDPENGIEIVGKWAYSTTPPDDIEQACIRWGAYMYRQKDAQLFDVTAIPDAGVIQIPKGIPEDVRLLLEPYVRTH